MSTYTPIYRATVYARRSVDPTETTVLTPPGGAPHSDEFKVSTKALTGYKAYMSLPRGRRGRIDPLSRSTDTGELSLDLLDKRTGTTNLERWVTAFGDVSSCKVIIEESLNDGGSWETHFTGRIRNPNLVGRTKIGMQIRDISDEMKSKAFVGKPHSSISYAYMAPLIPVGPLETYGGLTAEPWSTATVLETYAFGNTFDLYNSDVPWHRNLFTSAWPQAGSRRYRQGDYFAIDKHPNLRIHVKRLDTMAEGEFKYGHATLSQRSQSGQFHVERLQYAEALDSTHVDYIAPITAGVDVELYVYADMAPDEMRPLVVNDVHAVTFIKNILEGKFGRLKSADGSVLKAWDYDTATFTTLEADASIGVFRGLIDRSWEVREILDQICLQFNLAWFINTEGEVSLVSMAPVTSIAGVPTLVNSDVHVSGDAAPYWIKDDGAAKTKITITRYKDVLVEGEDLKNSTDIPPRISSIRVTSEEVTEVMLDVQNPDLEGEIDIEAFGHRYFEGEKLDGVDRGTILQDRLRLLAESFRLAFANGPQFARVPFRRTANVTSIVPGNLRILDIDELVDHATLVRGGARVMRAIEVTYNGPVIEVLFLDLGISTSASAPTINSVSVDATTPEHVIAIDLVKPAGADRIRIDVAAVVSGGARPADDSSEWRFARYVEASGTYLIIDNPSRRTIHVRARGEGDTGDFKVASAWIYGSVTTTAYSAPSAAGMTDVTSRTGLLSWTLNETARSQLQTEVLLVLGGVPASWSDSDVIHVLHPDSIRKAIDGLDGPTIQHTIGVRHRDRFGGDTTVAAYNFSTTSAAAQAPTPLLVKVLS